MDRAVGVGVGGERQWRRSAGQGGRSEWIKRLHIVVYNDVHRVRAASGSLRESCVSHSRCVLKAPLGKVTGGVGEDPETLGGRYRQRRRSVDCNSGWRIYGQESDPRVLNVHEI